MTDYNDGEWHVWRGKKGDVCPVHEKSIGDVTYADGEVRHDTELGIRVFDQPLMFRVIEPYREPREPREWLLFLNASGDVYGFHEAVGLSHNWDAARTIKVREVLK